jgi:hypothetical protein
MRNNFLGKLTAVLAALVFVATANASIVINELMSKNVSFKTDDRFQFSGWAELYNNGAETVDISLYFFSEDRLSPTQWQMVAPDNKLEIKPGEYVVVYFDETEQPDSDDDESDPIPLHADFKLDAKNGCLYLANEAGKVIDEICYDTAYRNISYGRLVDGEETLGYMTQPTPGAANVSSSVATVKTATPKFSIAPGFYTEELSLELSAENSNATIYYTTNGDEPTTQSAKYESAIAITKNTPVRAICVVEGEMPSDVVTASYFINETVHKLPIVSLVSDSALLFGDELGLLVAGVNGAEVPSGCNGPDRRANYQNDWDRPANFEFFDRNKQPQISQEVKIGNFGGCSRTKYIKSIKVNASKTHGDNKLEYSIFEEKPNLKWKSVVLRNAGNDFGRSYLRDGFIQTLTIGQMDIDHQAYQPSIVFINGEFYGMLNIRERSNKDFVYSNYGLDENEIFINEGNYGNDSESGYGDLQKLCEKEDMNEEGFFDHINRHIDVDEFLNYFLVEMYCGNQDWPGGNIKCWKKRSNLGPNTDGRWRWILYDTEFSTSLYSRTTATNCFTYANKHKLFKPLTKNDIVRERLLAKFCVHLATTFEPKRANSILDSLINNITPDVDRHIQKINDAYKLEEKFEDDINDIRQFVDNRIKYIHKYIKTNFKAFGIDTMPIRIFSELPTATYKINEEPIRQSDFSGHFFTKTNCRIVANEPEGYNFDHWKITIPDSIQPKEFTLKDTAFCDTFCGGVFEAVYVPDPAYTPNANNIYFNEVCASNSIFVDESRESEDWIEFYNSSDSDIKMGGLFLSNNKENLGLFEIPDTDETIIKAKDYIAFWADKDTTDGALHLNFKLTVGIKTTLFLSKKNGDNFEIIDSVSYAPHKENESLARFGNYSKEGTVWKLTGRTTFKKPNIYGHLLDAETIVSGENIATIYPNPVENELFFSFSWEKASNCVLYSISGEAIMNFEAKTGDSINLENLTPGFYMIAIESPNGRITAKVIKK